jgi:hypothetical protein
MLELAWKCFGVARRALRTPEVPRALSARPSPRGRIACPVIDRHGIPTPGAAGGGDRRDRGGRRARPACRGGGQPARHGGRPRWRRAARPRARAGARHQRGAHQWPHRACRVEGGRGGALPCVSQRRDRFAHSSAAPPPSPPLPHPHPRPPAQKPTSVHWDPFGNVYILEKAGVVKRMTSWTGVPTDIVLDISAQVRGARRRRKLAAPARADTRTRPARAAPPTPGVLLWRPRLHQHLVGRGLPVRHVHEGAHAAAALLPPRWPLPPPAAARAHALPRRPGPPSPHARSCPTSGATTARTTGRSTGARGLTWWAATSTAASAGGPCRRPAR